MPLRKENGLAGIDARIKSLVSLAILVMIVSYRGFFFPWVITLFCLYLSIRIKVPVKAFLYRFSQPLVLALVIVLLKLFFSGEDRLFSIGFSGVQVVGYRDGLIEGVRAGSRIMGAVSVLIVMSFVTPFAGVIETLSWLRMPRGFIDVVLFAHRYLFVLFEEAQVIYTAQKNRFGYSTIRSGLNSLAVLAGSLTLKAFTHSQNIAVAMVQRGYVGVMPMPRQKPFLASEVVGSIVFVLTAGFIWMI